jgi:DNA-binding MarR family transcriptional regulator
LTRAALQSGSPEVQSEASIDLGWDELGLVAEGIAYAQRPLKAATRQVTRQYDLGPRGPWILSLISGGKCYPLELSQALRAGRSLITAELIRLTAAGLVTAQADSDDRRRSRLTLTALGTDACERVRSEMARILKRNLTDYSAEEVRLFIRMMRDVRRLEADETEAGC